MTAERWHRIERVFAEAVARTGADRQRHVHAACGEDRALRRDVERLLAAGECAEARIDKVIHESLRWLERATEAFTVGERIGRYVVERPLRRGGLCCVYRAQPVGSSGGPPVAIKVLRRGMISTPVLGRVQAERRILAGLEHPNIPRLLSSGETRDGLPFWVVEYVEGRTILEHSVRQRLTVEQRLRLFQSACVTVGHLHRQRIAHGDIKPGHLLMGRDGAPKLIDFGTAESLAPDGCPRPDREALRFFTPAYASPEQIGGGPMGVRSDVYSLGVVLFELLTGRRPHAFDPRSRLGDWATPKPSWAVIEGDRLERAAFAGGCGLTPKSLAQRLERDLDKPILDALHVDPARRPASADVLAASLENP